jgi:dihydroxyacid dehydratase/phosphogluconate dehydratase
MTVRKYTKFKSIKATGNIQNFIRKPRKAVLPRLVEMKESILKEMLLFMKMSMISPAFCGGEVKPGNVVVIRYSGPKCGPT